MTDIPGTTDATFGTFIPYNLFTQKKEEDKTLRAQILCKNPDTHVSESLHINLRTSDFVQKSKYTCFLIFTHKSLDINFSNFCT